MRGLGLRKGDGGGVYGFRFLVLGIGDKEEDKECEQDINERGEIDMGFNFEV